MSKVTVTGVERVLDVFEAFREQKNPLSMTELSEVTGIPKSTCHAILTTLQSRGYMYSLNRPRAHYPTNRLYDVASEIKEHDVFVKRATPLLEKLRDVTGETLILGKRQGDQAVYLQVVESPHSIRYSAQIGDLKPLHSRAMGKALLGSMKNTELKSYLEGRKLSKITSETILEVKELEEQIREGKKIGYFQTRGEHVSDVWAMSTYLNVGADVFALAMAGPANRMENLPTEHLHLLIGAGESVAKMASA